MTQNTVSSLEFKLKVPQTQRFRSMCQNLITKNHFSDKNNTKPSVQQQSGQKPVWGPNCFPSTGFFSGLIKAFSALIERRGASVGPVGTLTPVSQEVTCVPVPASRPAGHRGRSTQGLFWSHDSRCELLWSRLGRGEGAALWTLDRWYLRQPLLLFPL